jgi:alpha-glucosidase
MIMRGVFLAALLLAGIASTDIPLRAAAQSDSTTASADANWWKHAVFYEIYPRSFADSNNDGIGDLPGITSRMDYLKWLGVDAVWIAPMFPSPQVDFGYDVSDFQNVDPQYGTLADMDMLIAAGKDRGIRTILDYVINHTSDKHAWFEESRKSRENPKRDWYVWRDGKASGQPPSNWIAHFGGSAWKFDAATKQYYYHAFYTEQPDLNWRNPVVETAMFDVARWWYKRGVAGFRLDAVDTIFEDPELRDNPETGGKNAYGDPRLKRVYDAKLPELHGVLQRLRKVSDEFQAVLVGETWTTDVEELKKYYGAAETPEVHLPMDFLFCNVNKLSAPAFRAQIEAIEGSGQWPVYVLSNHDIVRHYNRYGDGIHNDEIAKVMAMLYLTLRGTPIMYYGEELGMENHDPQRIEDVKDPRGRAGWPKEKGRDGERTPMQWSAAKNAGFSEHDPWNAVGPRYGTYNVESEKADPKSILNFYQQLLKLRHEHPALRDGSYSTVLAHPNVLAFMRSAGTKKVLVTLNMSGEQQSIPLMFASQAPISRGRVLLSSTGTSETLDLKQPLALEPFAAILTELE